MQSSRCRYARLQAWNINNARHTASKSNRSCQWRTLPGRVLGGRRARAALRHMADRLSTVRCTNARGHWLRGHIAGALRPSRHLVLCHLSACLPSCCTESLCGCELPCPTTAPRSCSKARPTRYHTRARCSTVPRLIWRSWQLLSPPARRGRALLQAVPAAEPSRPSAAREQGSWAGILRCNLPPSGCPVTTHQARSDPP